MPSPRILKQHFPLGLLSNQDSYEFVGADVSKTERSVGGVEKLTAC